MNRHKKHKTLNSQDNKEEKQKKTSRLPQSTKIIVQYKHINRYTIYLFHNHNCFIIQQI